MNKLKLYSLFLFLVLMSLGNSLSAQNLFFNWVDADGGIGEDFVSDVAVDANGNIYAVGSFSGTVIFDSTLANGTLYATGNLDIFVSKTNKYGTLLWVKKIGGNDDDIASSIALDSNNNIYITGSFQGTCDFNPSVSATYIASAINGTSDIFVCKLNTNGNFAWVANIDGDKIPDIAIDADNNILATGTFSTDVDFDPGTGIFNIPATDETIFIWKLSSSGSFIWANEIDGNASSDNGYGIAVDANKNVYVTGSFQIAVDCDPAGSGYFLYSNGSLDVFIAKFNAAGALHWAKSIGGGASDEGLYVEIDNENNLYLSGIFSNVVDFDPSGGGTVNLGSKGAQDVFLLKLDSTGTFKWANSIGSASADGCGSIKSDSENGQVICGYFQDTLKLDAPNDTIHLISNGSIDAFFARYDSLGNLSWAYSFGGSNDDVAKAVGVQYPSNQIVLAGSFTSSNMDFDPDTSSVYRSTKGGSDGFVSRFNRCFKDSLITIIGCDSVVGPSGNKSWYATGIYLDTIFSGCGGYAYVVNAIIPIDTANAISIKSCVGYASPSGTYYWTQSGTYKDTMFNGSYCGKDSINTIYLTIDTIPKKTYLVSECHEFVSPSKKYSWYKSGTYLDTVPAPNNLCDSVLTINLTILESYDTLDVEVCEQYLSPSGKYIYSKPGLYNDTLVNSNKCDSIITINLKNVFTPTFSTQNVSACNEYTSPSGKYKWVTNTIAKDTIANSHGCDSVITFNVTFGKSYSSANLQGCVPYLSPSTKHMWTMSGKQFDTISNHKGCDSIMVINFKALQGSSAQLTTFGCNTYTAPSGNHTWTSSGIYTDTLINSLGCDSILTIDLTIVETVKDISRNGDSLIMPVTGLKYQWLNCDEGYKKVIGATKPYLLPLDEAFYAVEIKNNECFDTSICLTTSRVGLETPTKHRFTVFPNPTSGSLNIQLADYVVNINCKISSIDGRLISEEEVGSTKNFKIELPGEIGLYMLTLYSNYELIGRALVVKK